MKATLITYLPWLLSLLTILTMAMAGNKKRRTWLIALFNNGLWLLFIVLTGAWGLLPMNIALWYVYARNHFKWI